MDTKPYALVCLYSTAAPTADFDKIIGVVRNDPQFREMQVEVLTRLAGRLISLGVGGQFSLQVLVRNEQYDVEKLSIGLWGSKTTTINNNYETRILEHESFVSVTVECEEDVPETLEMRRLRLYALQLVTEHLYLTRKPSLVFSSLADSLIEPATAPRSYSGKFDSRLFEQAVLSSRGGKVGSGAPIGATIRGSEEIVGIPVLLREVPFPSWALCQASSDFFAHFDRLGIPEDGTIFKGVEGYEEYAVRHMERVPRFPHGYIEITITRNYRAEERDLDNSIKYPDLLSTDKAVKRNRAPKRKSERSPMIQAAIIAAAVAVSVAIAYLVKG